MAKPPPAAPSEPDDETIVVPPADRPPAIEETVVADDWGPESEVFVEETETPPRRRTPVIWPWLLALLLLVLGGLGAYYVLSQDDDDGAAATTATVARVEVPLLVGLREEQAKARVQEEGLEPTVERQESAKPRGVVFAQDPSAGAGLERGESVLLTVSSGPPKETVPDVVGQPAAEAVQDLQAAGLEALRSEAFGAAEQGTVLRQDPAGGSTLRQGGTVALVVSKGPQPVAVPDVVGTTSSEATSALREVGFEVNLVAVPSDRPAGTVVAQSPAAGGKAPKGSEIRLNVAQKAGETTPATTTPATSDSEPATVPDVVGQELADAARAFNDEGLKVAVAYVPSDEPRGRVVAQAQPAGTERKRGDTVQVNVATGPSPPAQTAVPDVAGLRQTPARRELEAAGFEVLALPRQTSDRSRAGFVLSQTPSGGAGIPRGSLVLLYVGA